MERRRLERRYRDTLRRLALIAVACWAVVGTVAAIALVLALAHADSVNSKATTAVQRADSALLATRALLRVQHGQLVQGCIRLNIQRGEQTISNLADFYVDRTVLVFSQVAKNTDPRAVRFEKAFLPKLRFAVTHKEWTPLTDCGKAITNSGRFYRSPRPVPFVKRIPRPSQYNIANTGRLSPNGT